MQVLSGCQHVVTQNSPGQSIDLTALLFADQLFGNLSQRKSQALLELCFSLFHDTEELHQQYFPDKQA